MKKLQTTSRFHFIKWNGTFKKLSVIGALLISPGIFAQNNASYNANSVPVPGTGSDNSAFGAKVLFSNTTGSYNTATGTQALYYNTSGWLNAAYGLNSSHKNTTGQENSSYGTQSLFNNTTGNHHTAIGLNASYSNTTGGNNTGIGYSALYYNTTGSYNTALGIDAGPYYSSVNYDNSTALGNGATTYASNQVRIGNASVASIGGYQNWTNYSDRRIKKDIEEKVPGLEFINKLRPVTYHLDLNAIAGFSNKSQNPHAVSIATGQATMLHSGLIAQEVEKVATELGYDFSGVDKPQNNDDLYGLRYAEFTIPLIKAVQELSKQNAEQQQTNEALKKELAELRALIKTTTGTLPVNPSESGQALLYQNTPNPVSQATNIRYAIPATAKKAVLQIVSIKGEKVKEIDLTGRGQASVDINAGELAAGVYVYSLIVDGNVIDSKKMTLTE